MPPETSTPVNPIAPTVLIFRSGTLEVAHRPVNRTFVVSINGSSRSIDYDEATLLRDALDRKIGQVGE